jgi:hypothetical protein
MLIIMISWTMCTFNIRYFIGNRYGNVSPRDQKIKPFVNFWLTMHFIWNQLGNVSPRDQRSNHLLTFGWQCILLEIGLVLFLRETTDLLSFDWQRFRSFHPKPMTWCRSSSSSWPSPTPSTTCSTRSTFNTK